MKLNGEFVIREVMGDIIAVPVGNTAKRIHGMIMLNEVSKVIMQCLENDTDIRCIVERVTEIFDVAADQAESDIREFLNGLSALGVLDQ